MREFFFSTLNDLLLGGDVSIDNQAIAQLKPDFSQFGVAALRLPFDVENPRDALLYILAQTALQYRFWDGFGAQYQRYAVGNNVGSTAMAAGFAGAWGAQPQPGPAIIDCARAVHATTRAAAAKALEPAFGAIPDPVSRVVILGEVLFSSKVPALIESLDADLRSGEVGVVQALRIARQLPVAYGDPLIKKAMLALALMVAEYRRAGITCKESLMAYADYQVPSVLRHLGILKYSPKLEQKIDTYQHIPKGSASEYAIRAGTIVACERIAEQFGVTAAEVDWFLWTKRKEPVKPFHLTATTAY